MRLLYIADGRSPTALNWLQYFIEQGHEVHLASSYACQPDLPLASLTFVPIAFSGLKTPVSTRASLSQPEPATRNALNPGKAALIQFRTRFRQFFGPLTLPKAARQIRGLVSDLRPDLVHAMRIPYEGMAAVLADPGCPLLVSVWGNDFTLHARATPWMAHLTRQVMQRASALHTDCQRDLSLARRWGFPAHRPAVVLPGAGGIQTGLFHPESSETPARARLVVINPRGFRAYVRNDTFFQSIPLILARQPETLFLCPAMANEPLAERWVQQLGVAQQVHLLPRQTRPQMAELFRQAQVVVSVTTHDGTPNSLLEAMACGCVPVAGDLESLREWITPGVNGFLIDAGSPQALAEAVLSALAQPDFRRQAQQHNLQIIMNRAEYRKVMDQAEAFYQNLVRPS